MTKTEKAFSAWWAKNFPHRGDPVSDYELRIFEAGAHAALDFNRPIIKALEERVATLEAREKRKPIKSPKIVPGKDVILCTFEVVVLADGSLAIRLVEPAREGVSDE
jgi:hypothetical protein